MDRYTLLGVARVIDMQGEPAAELTEYGCAQTSAQRPTSLAASYFLQRDLKDSNPASRLHRSMPASPYSDQLGLPGNIPNQPTIREEVGNLPHPHCSGPE
ncbi:hypothetical protein GOP47_0029961 [Adiantum capillus-veneris]|nr:hypothetical protein GOP47_0029961 [Adiantum capillus-veneris]